jgi:hypothetical protein
MMGLGRIFARSSELKRFQLALEEIDFDILRRFSSVREFLNTYIKRESAAAESRSVIEQLIANDIDPKVTAYLFMRVLLEDLLLDGHYHVLPGKLDTQGENLLAIYNNVVRELRTLGWFSGEEAEVHFLQIRNGIAATLPAENNYKTSA